MQQCNQFSLIDYPFHCFYFHWALVKRHLKSQSSVVPPLSKKSQHVPARLSTVRPPSHSEFSSPTIICILAPLHCLNPLLEERAAPDFPGCHWTIAASAPPLSSIGSTSVTRYIVLPVKVLPSRISADLVYESRAQLTPTSFISSGDNNAMSSTMVTTCEPTV